MSSCFGRPDSFSAVPRASGPVFMLCTPGLVFGGTGGVGCRFLILCSLTSFRRYRGRRISFSCFALPGHFRRCRGRQVPFYCFALPDSFSAVPEASGAVFLFCAPGLIFGGAGDVRSRFIVLRFWTHFRPFRWLRVPFSCFVRLEPFSYFARPDSFSAVPGASGPVFMLCTPGLVFGGTGGVGCRFLVFCSRTHYLRCRGRRVPFSCFALPDSFLAVPRASRTIFIFCAPRLVFDGTGASGPSLLFSAHSFSAVSRASGPFSMFFALGHILCGTEGVWSSFHVLRFRTRFRRYRGRRVPFSSSASLNSFSAVPRASGPVFTFCAPGLLFGNTVFVGSRFHVLCARTRFRLSRVRRVPFSCFACPDSFSAVPRASGPIFMFCAP
jgi:hypothetical protein